MVENPGSLIVRMLGLYEITMFEGISLDLIVMSNIFNSHLPIHRKFDLKGSWVNRSNRSFSSVRRFSNVVGYDSDMVEAISIERSESVVIAEQIKKDTGFLSGLGIMDYSLLVGIHDKLLLDTWQKSDSDDDQVDEEEEEEEEAEEEEGEEEDRVPKIEGNRSSSARTSALENPTRRGIESKDSTLVYFIGIIDILQEYNLEKKTEHFLKTKVLKRDASGISAIPPVPYAQRFQEYIKKKIQV